MTKKKNIIAAVILVVGIGISAYLWTSQEGNNDQSIAQKTMTFTCPECKSTFDLTVAESAEMRRNNEGKVVCKNCGKSGAEKHDVLVSVSGSGGFSSGEEKPAEQTEATAEKPPKLGGTGRKKKPK